MLVMGCELGEERKNQGGVHTHRLVSVMGKYISNEVCVARYTGTEKVWIRRRSEISTKVL